MKTAYVYFREFFNGELAFDAACDTCHSLGFATDTRKDYMLRRECWIFVATLKDALALNELIRNDQIECRAGKAGL